jgi:hypothetical protein
MIVAKAAMVAGTLLFGASLLGAIRSDAIVLVIGIAVTIASIGFTEKASTLSRVTMDISKPTDLEVPPGMWPRPRSAASVSGC